MTFHLTCVNIILSSVWIAEWPPFGKWLLTRLTICSLCILSICNYSYFPFWFEGWIPDLCILFTFYTCHTQFRARYIRHSLAYLVLYLEFASGSNDHT